MPKQTAHQLIQDIEKELNSVKLEVTDLNWKIKSLQSKAGQLEDTLEKVENQLIPKVEYTLLKQIVFSAVGLILISVVGALVALVVRQ